MSSFYLAFKDMLKEYGVDIVVYPYSRPSDMPHFHYVGGIKVDDGETDLVKKETRHEPVLPANSQSSILGQFLSGGLKAQVDLIWLSSGGLYPKNTIVDIPSQGGKFRVINFSNYKDYSDVVIYGLKGDDQHPEGR